MQRFLIPVVAASLALPAATQLVSPVDFANKHAKSTSVVPFSGWAGEINYQQVHSDLEGRSQAVVKGIAFRRGATNQTAGFTLNCELIVGEGSYAFSPWRTFAMNFATPPVVAMQRRRINFPAWTGSLPVLPPFDAQFPFDAPWAFTGRRGFVWQLKVFSSTLSRYQLIYPDASHHPDYNMSSSIMTSTTCRASGQTLDHRLISDFRTYLIGRKHTLRWYGHFYPRNAPWTVILGTNKVSIPFPGLCQPLGVQPVLTALGGTTTATGSISVPMLTLPFDKNLVGFALHSQAVAVDLQSSHAIPAVVSLVNTNRLPAQPTKTILCASLYRSGTGSTSATTAAELSLERTLVVQLMR